MTLACASFVALASCAPAGAASEIVMAPVAAQPAEETPGLKTAIFAGGCFWGVEAVFSHVNGVTSAVSGYHGGSRADARYGRIGRGDTGHAETVRVTYDPAVVRYDQLLRVFFSVVADPTQLDRQGPDVGSQYRTALVPVSGEQRATATAYLAQLRGSGLWKTAIVTRIEPLRRFYPAEAEHQDFAANNARHPYILRWDAPKVSGLARLFPQHYRRGFVPG